MPENLTPQKMASLREIADRAIGLECVGVLGIFLEKYVRCEALAGKLVVFYAEDTKRSPSRILQKQQIQAALKWYGEGVFNEEELARIFAGGQGKRHEKSARQLRNGYLHSLSPNDRDEIETKQGELSRLMDKSIGQFKNRSDQTNQGLLPGQPVSSDDATDK